MKAYEDYLHKSGIGDIEKIRPWNEARMRARWRLGQLLAGELRGVGPGRGKKKLLGSPTSFRALLSRIKFDVRSAMEAQQLGTLPAGELDKALADNKRNGVLASFADLRRIAGPYWYKASREKKHKDIAQTAKLKMVLE